MRPPAPFSGLLAALAAAALLSATPAAGASPTPRAAGESGPADSPWPRTSALGPNLRAARNEIDKLERQVELMELSAARYHNWETCLTYVPVSEYGDPWDATRGFLYDERDGTGAGLMDALAIDRKSRPRHEDYMFIDFDRDHCRTDAPQPGGTAEPASLHGLRGPATRASRLKGRGALKAETRRLERRALQLSRRVQLLDAASERFDEWESCVSWVPVTEQGGADGTFGYLYGTVGSAPGYRTALHIDRSDWDDPDYMFLALVGGDRPGRSCQDEPGEAID